MNLEYFIASLPMLLRGREAPVTLLEFRSRCVSSLNDSLNAAVAALCAEGISDHPFVTAWFERELRLRQAVAARRRVRLRESAPADSLRTQVPSEATEYDARVQAAFDESNPLRREDAIDAIRWDIADEMQGVQPFSENVILAYTIKLHLALRHDRRDAASGRARFDELVTPSGLECER